jgi:hypothetical protein
VLNGSTRRTRGDVTQPVQRLVPPASGMQASRHTQHEGLAGDAQAHVRTVLHGLLPRWSCSARQCQVLCEHHQNRAPFTGHLSCLSLTVELDTDDHWARYLEVTVWYLLPRMRCRQCDQLKAHASRLRASTADHVCCAHRPHAVTRPANDWLY